MFAFLSLGLVLFVGRDFLPYVDSGQMRLHVRCPAGTRIEESERFARNESTKWRDYILEVFGETEWIIGGLSGAARRLALPRTTLISKIKKLGIAPRRSALLCGADRASLPV